MSYHTPACICGHRDAAHELTFMAPCTECACPSYTPPEPEEAR